MTELRYFRTKRVNRKSVFFKFLISYMVVLLVSVSIGSVLYYRVQTEMVDTAGRAYLGMLDQVKQVVDTRMKEMNGAALQMILSPKLQYLLNLTDNTTIEERYMYFDFMKDMQRIKTSIGWMNDFYIYLQDAKTVMTPDAKTDVETFFSTMMVGADASYKGSMMEKLGQYNVSEFVPSVIMGTGSNQKRIISYLQTLPLGSKTIKGTLVINIDEQQIGDLLHTIEMASQAQIYIADAKKQVLLEPSNKKWNIPDMLERMLSDPPHTAVKDDRGKTMVVSRTVSQDNGWTYIAVVPRDVVMQRVNKLKSYAIMLLCFYLLVGAIASYLLAYRNYNPIREMVQLLQKAKGAETKDTNESNESNEFDYIKRMLSGTAYEEKQLRDKLTRQTPIIQANFLSRLLRGRVDVAAMTEEEWQEMGIRIPVNGFAVMLIDIDDSSAFAKEDSEREWALIRFIVSNLGEELMKGEGYVTELDRQQLAVLAGLGGQTAASGEHEIKALAEEFQTILYRRFRLQTTIAVSEIHREIEQTELAYRQALMALEYKLVKDSNSVIMYDETRGLQQNQYHFPLELEVQLLNYAKAGDYSSIDKLLDQIYEMNFVSHKVSPENGKCLFFDIVCTLLKLMNSTSAQHALHVLHEKYDPVKTILSRATAAEMLQKTKECYEAVCELTREHHSSHSDKLLDGMKQYLENRYADNNFNLTSMAEQFDLTPKYISAFFKKQTSQNIMDYVVEMRIAHAKRLLQDRSLTLLQIAQQVGYVNDVGLIRVFKKMEGVTPGLYRDTLPADREATRGESDIG
ncbi:helix-turn-helix domain-containing protein [Paenibacillus hodogayensis]|uniref:Helix-turn-helix domain-containing protein n=1 Tax=Paenibacillus hodogayensis TaxID=279208 RepID=A0ABV5W6E6_9BACL